MRVLMIVTWYSSRYAEVMTSGVFHYEQSIALKKYADIALLYPYDSEFSGKISKKEEDGLVTYRYSAKNKNMLFGFSEIVKAGKKVIKDYHPDIIHAHVAQGAGRLAYALSKATKIPYIVTEHSPIEQSNLDNTINRLLTRLVYKNSRANICVSGDSRDRLKGIFPKCDFSIIYNGIINPETVKDDGNYYRKDGYVNILITAAFYDKYVKGYQYLLPAIRKLRDEKKKVFLHICGGGDFLDFYKKMACDLCIEDSVNFYGQCSREKVYSIMRQMDFSVSSSEYECSGVSVQEAMFLKNPMLVTRSGGANSLVTDKTAIVVDRKSIDALVEGIKNMIKKLDSFDREFIREYAENHFEIDHVSKEYFDLYNSIIN